MKKNANIQFPVQNYFAIFPYLKGIVTDLYFCTTRPFSLLVFYNCKGICGGGGHFVADLTCYPGKRLG